MMVIRFIMVFLNAANLADIDLHFSFISSKSEG